MIARTSDDREVYFRSEGNGVNLLLVHGGSPDHFDGLVGLLSVRHKCVTFDRLGFGRSAWLDRSTTIPEQVDAIEAVHRSVGSGPAWVLGWSSGGNFALAYALMHPERVKGLILVEPALYAIYPPDGRPTEIDRMEAAVLLIQQGEVERGWDEFFEAIFKQRRSAHAPPRTHEALANIRCFGFDQPVVISWCPSEDELREVKQPVLVIEGDRSPPVLRDITHLLHRRLSASTLVTLEGQDHGMPIDAPEVVAEQIEAFVTRCDGGSQA